MISRIEGVRRLTQEQARANPAAELVGVITWLDGANSGFVLADDTSAIWVYGPVPADLAVGNRVQVWGRAIEGYFTVTLRADRVNRRTEGLRDDWVLVRGGGAETLRFERESGPADRLAELPVDSTVEAQGVLLPLTGSENRPVEAELYLDSSDSIRLVEGPPLPRRLTLTFAVVAAVSVLGSLGAAPDGSIPAACRASGSGSWNRRTSCIRSSSISAPTRPTPWRRRAAGLN